ncbi:Transposase [Jeotgalicoccus saudimassiliensis]|uniref:Transposase n=1 Tax=Jeotgalicoccus saudimassiliensis TaxID=1461582 RepID=A0A078M320_9STAP|nr:helix-turn-helix domain-containing protein [Jeotgalicoccus saudimassiliensis]CEA01978.1 Transposase [Jeotgalicoccus saudimassiliensis]
MYRKHSIDFKIKVVNEYLTGNNGFNRLESKYGITSSLIRTWVNQFNQNGVQGLTAGMTKSTYSKSFKLEVIQYRLEHHLSYRETANAFDIPNPSIIAQWQSRYHQYGILGLETQPKGRPSKLMNKKQSRKKRNESQPLNETEREELERLRIENRKLEVAIALEKKLQSLARDKRTKK